MIIMMKMTNKATGGMKRKHLRSFSYFGVYVCLAVSIFCMAKKVSRSRFVLFVFIKLMMSESL